MKKLFIIFGTTLIAATSLNAQTLAALDPNDKRLPAASAEPSVKYITPSVETASMNVFDNNVVFDNLPRRGELNLYLTDAKGNILKKQTITAHRNSLDISKLKKGTHFITLENEYSGKRKGFMLSLQ